MIPLNNQHSEHMYAILSTEEHSKPQFKNKSQWPWMGIKLERKTHLHQQTAAKPGFKTAPQNTE